MASWQYPLGIDLLVGGTWESIPLVDVSAEGVHIRRGRSDESGTPDPSAMTVRVRNDDGRWSPRNPNSPLYRQIGRNTPVRCWVRAGRVRLVQPSGVARAECPDSAALSPAGDLDLRVDVSLRSWRPASAVYIGIHKPDTYGLFLTADGHVAIIWTDSAAGEARYIASTAPVPGMAVGRKAVRASLDADNGSGGCSATFYVADTIAGPWVQFGGIPSYAGTAVIADTTSPLGTDTGDVLGTTQVHAVEVRSAGVLVASPDFGSATAGAPSLTDGQGNVWTAVGSAALTDLRTRFLGEVTSWPVSWEPDGSKVVTTLECSGVTRRLGQGASPVQSAIRRALSRLANSVAYWPCEDSAQATQVSTTHPGARPGTVRGRPGWASYGEAVCSDPILTLADSTITLPVAAPAPTGEAQVRWLIHASDTLPADSVLASVYATNSLSRIDIHITSAGGWYAKVYGSVSGTAVLTTATMPSILGGDYRLSLELRQVAANVEVKLVAVEAGSSSGTVVTSTATALVLGGISRVTLNPLGVDLGDTAVGHVTVEKAISTVFDVIEQLRAYAGERADTRIVRLAGDAGVTVQVVGASGGAERVGAQRSRTLMDLLREAADADGGILAEPRDAQGLELRTLASMYGQTPTLTASYGSLIELAPTDDDQRSRNVVQVTRDGGATAEVRVDSGPMSTLAPPAGIGVYDESVTLSLAADEQARHQASWRAALGTVEDARYPQIGADLYASQWAGHLDQSAALLDVDLGDRIDITDLPVWLPPGPVSAIVQGYEESITPDSWRLTFNTTPAAPYRVGSWAGSVATITQEATMLLADDFSGTEGSPWDSALWDAGELLAGASATRSAGVGVLNAGTLTGWAGRCSMLAKLAARADADVTVDIQWDATESYAILQQRAPGDGTGSTGYMLQMSLVDQRWRLMRLTSWTEAPVGAEVDYAWTAGVTYRVRWRLVGVRHQVKVWPAAAPEPALWGLDATDPEGHTAPGRIGVQVAGGAAAGGTLRVDRVRIAATDAASVAVAGASPGAGRWNMASTVDVTVPQGSPGSASSIVVRTAAGKGWSTAGYFPYSIQVGPEVMAVTAATALASGVQTLTVTRGALSPEHPQGTAVTLADPYRWGARPPGGVTPTSTGTSQGGGTGTAGGGTGTEPGTPSLVRIGSATYPLAGINPGTAGGVGGDTAYPGGRGVDQLIVYRAPVTITVTNPWGVEVTVSSDGVVLAVNNRTASQSATGTSVPVGGSVLSGHGAAGDWLLANATVGATVELTSVGDTGGGSTGGGGTTGGGSTSTTRSGLPFQMGVFDTTLTTAKFDAFAVMMGRPLDFVSQHADWADLGGGSTWWIDPHKGRGYNISISGPLFQNVATNSAAKWTALANELKAGGFLNPFVRLGVEYNLSNSWKCTDANRLQWQARFAEMSTAIKAVLPGARIILCPNEGLGQGELSTANTALVATELAPYYDIIGVDYYDQWEPIFTPAQAAARFGTASIFGTMNYWLARARVLGKRFGLPEWGVSSGTTWAPHNGGDNPFYIQYVMDWLAANAPDVEMAAYFEEPLDYLDSDITTTATNPQARQAFIAKVAQYSSGSGSTGGGTTGGGTGGGSTSTTGAYPATSASVYKLMWPSDAALTAVPSNVKEIRISFAQGTPPSMVGWTSSGQASALSRLAAMRQAGCRIVVSVGGEGGNVLTTNRALFLSGITAIRNTLASVSGGGLDGMDWDIEIGSSFPTADAVYISTQLKAMYGSGFAITMAPNGNNVGSYLPAAVQLHQAGALDFYGQQFYDYPNPSYGDVAGRLSEAISRGIPASKLGIGFALTSRVANGAWSVSGAQSAMAQAKAQFGVRKAYLWAEDSLFSNGQVAAWVNAMAAVQ